MFRSHPMDVLLRQSRPSDVLVNKRLVPIGLYFEGLNWRNYSPREKHLVRCLTDISRLGVKSVIFTETRPDLTRNTIFRTFKIHSK